MINDMVVAVFVLAFVAIILVMVTLGAVLVARFGMGAGNTSLRVLAAALGGPLVIVMPSLGLTFVDQAADVTPVVIGFGILLVIAFGAIGWPVAHFSTRRLDRLTRFNPQVFE